MVGTTKCFKAVCVGTLGLSLQRHKCWFVLVTEKRALMREFNGVNFAVVWKENFKTGI